MVVGQVSVLGIVSVYLQLRLDAKYGNGTFIGRGTVVFRIKICWCFTLSVRKSVEMRLGGRGANRAALEAPAGDVRLLVQPDEEVEWMPADASPDATYDDIASRYIDMLDIA